MLCGEQLAPVLVRDDRIAKSRLGRRCPFARERHHLLAVVEPGGRRSAGRCRNAVKLAYRATQTPP